jgi:hypothetical protein
VGWRDDILALLPEVPPEFTTRETRVWVPRLHHLHPDNNHIEEKIRQVLQDLRDEGLISFSPEGGRYRKLGSLADRNLIWPWKKGDELARTDVSVLFGQKGPEGLGRGMFRPGIGHRWRNHMVLFHNEEENPYNDTVENGRITYTGEGRKGDQKLTSLNRYLASHVSEGTHVHFFIQPKGRRGRIRYEGEVILENMRYEFRAEDGRSVYRFELVELESPDAIAQVGEEMADIQADARPPGFEERKSVQSLQRRLVRDPAFRTLVLDAYNQECAVCGRPLRKIPAIDLQAAHIIGVAERGRDEVRNGLALCSRHHWAFDRGFFSLTDAYRLIWLGQDDDPHDEMRHGEAVQVPGAAMLQPETSYLGFHRKKWKVPS